MPRLVLMVPETTESVLRPIVHEIARDLFQVTGIDPKSQIFFPGDHDKAKQTGSSITPSDEPNRFSFGSKLSIDVEETYEAERILSTAVLRPENLFVFRDDRIETSLKPAYAPSDVMINFRYRAQDKTAAMRFRDDVKTRISMGQSERLHSLTYHYLLPKEMLAILQELHRMREAVDGYGEDYETYLLANASKRLTKLSNLSGEQTAWGVTETQIRVVGWFTFDEAPEMGEKNSEGDTWQINFTYHFRYDKPIACVMQYPLVVHNQVVGRKWRPGAADRVERPEIHNRSYSLSSENFAHFEKGRTTSATLTPGAPGVSIPDYDEFIPASIVSGTLRVFTMLVTVDPENPTYLFDLNEIGTKWTLHPLILAYLIEQRQRLVVPQRQPFVLTFYQNRMIIPNVLTVDADGKVWSKVPLGLRDYYHVRLGLHRDWRTIDPNALDDLREDGELLTQIIGAIDPNVRPCMLSTGYVPRHCLAEAIDSLDPDRGNGQVYQFNTVQTLFIEAHKKEQ